MARLLILEPDNSIRRLMELVLAQANHQVVASVGSPVELNSQDPLVVDLALCDLGAFEAADVARVGDLRKKRPATTFLGTSPALATDECYRLATASGGPEIVEILSKPFNTKDLLAAIKRALA